MFARMLFHAIRPCRVSGVVLVAMLMIGCLSACQAGPTIVGHVCGTIVVNESGPLSNAGTPDMITCFQQAYAHCTSATLQFTISGLDASSTGTYTVQKSGDHCLLQAFGESETNGHSTQSGPFTCSSMERQDYGLVLHACGSLGNIIIPVPFPPVSGTSCGDIFVSQVGGSSSTWLVDVSFDPRSAFSCLTYAYQECRPALVDFDFHSGGRHQVSVQQQQKACILQDAVGAQRSPTSYIATYRCAGLKLQSQTLHIFRCGSEGDISVSYMLVKRSDQFH